MRRLYTCTAALAAAGVIALLVPGAAQAETLQESLALAYSNNPTLLAARAELRATDETLSQAVAGWRPTIQFDGDVGYLDTTSTSNFGVGGAVETEDTLTPKSYSFSVVEPLYRGGRTVAETAAAENRIEAGRSLLLSSEQRVLLDGVTNYMDVLQQLAEVDLNRNNERVVRRQLEAAQDRFDVGEVTRTDVAQAEARLAQARAERVAAEGALISARGTYRQVVGSLPGDLVWPGMPSSLPESEGAALELANRDNPQIIAAEYNERAARDDIDTAFSTLLPQVSVRGTYTQQFDQSSFTEESTSTSVTANLTVPFYQTGAEHSSVRQSKQIVGQRRMEIDEARRAVWEEVTRAWESLVTAQAQIQAFESQVRAAEIALDGVEQEALVGLRTTIDVLDAEQELFVAQVSLVRAQRDEIVSAYWVRSTIGTLTAASLGLPVDLYNVDEHYNDVRDKWFGVGDD
jgi:TolC family type I secretion outer membrane protein